MSHDEKADVVIEAICVRLNHQRKVERYIVRFAPMEVIEKITGDSFTEVEALEDLAANGYSVLMTTTFQQGDEA